jgi:hypothetical protein
VAARGFVDPDRARGAIEPRVRVGLVKLSLTSALASRRGASPLRHAAPHQPNFDPASSCEDGPPGRDGPEGSSSPVESIFVAGPSDGKKDVRKRNFGAAAAPITNFARHGPTMSRFAK